jgi:hypothetical protein
MDILYKYSENNRLLVFNGQAVRQLTSRELLKNRYHDHTKGE